jgi:uncharacterized Zn-binding protein involved in type VI secretion
MAVTVNVNNLSVVHQGSNGMAIASAPDVCKTPSPAGPVPIPYPNIAKSADLMMGTTTVTIDGNPAAVKDSSFGISTGDEAGSAGGGVVSNLIKGAAKFVNYSFDVKFEGKNVARLSDPMTMNGNAPNAADTAEIQQALTTLVGEDNLKMLCKAFCRCNSGGDPDGVVAPFDPNVA